MLRSRLVLQSRPDQPRQRHCQDETIKLSAGQTFYRRSLESDTVTLNQATSAAVVCFFQRGLPSHAQLRSCPGCAAVLWSSGSSFKAAGPQAAAGLPVGHSGSSCLPCKHINPASFLSKHLRFFNDDLLITHQSHLNHFTIRIILPKNFLVCVQAI